MKPSETGPQLRSPLETILNVAPMGKEPVPAGSGWAGKTVTPPVLSSAAASLENLFEQPADSFIATFVLASLSSLNVAQGYASLLRSLWPSWTVVLTVLRESCRHTFLRVHSFFSIGAFPVMRLYPSTLGRPLQVNLLNRHRL